MPHHLRLLGVLVLILTLGFAGSASAQSFSNVVVFGDSLSDSGNAAAASGLPPGTSFTTNPDPVWAEIIAGGLRRIGAKLARRRAELRLRRGVHEPGDAL